MLHCFKHFRIVCNTPCKAVIVHKVVFSWFKKAAHVPEGMESRFGIYSLLEAKLLDSCLV